MWTNKRMYLINGVENIQGKFQKNCLKTFISKESKSNQFTLIVYLVNYVIKGLKNGIMLICFKKVLVFFTNTH